MKHREGSPIIERIDRIEDMPPDLMCPCSCAVDGVDGEPDMVVSVLDDGEVRVCALCLAFGYACRLVPREGGGA